jgi:hypothetical protein
MRLYQDEVYRKGGKSIRILRLDRYEVEFKSLDEDSPREILPKKEFCRYIRGMTLVPPAKKEELPEAGL